MSLTEAKWITGPEFTAARGRLIGAGHRFDSPEYEALLRQVDERDEHLWEHYGLPLIGKHPGRWIAISADGEVLIGDDDLEVSERADERFGPGSYYSARLDENRGAPVLRPRSAR